MAAMTNTQNPTTPPAPAFTVGQRVRNISHGHGWTGRGAGVVTEVRPASWSGNVATYNVKFDSDGANLSWAEDDLEAETPETLEAAEVAERDAWQAITADSATVAAYLAAHLAADVLRGERTEHQHAFLPTPGTDGQEWGPLVCAVCLTPAEDPAPAETPAGVTPSDGDAVTAALGNVNPEAARVFALNRYLTASRIVDACTGGTAPALEDDEETYAAAVALAAVPTDGDAFNVWVSTFGLYNAGNLAGYWVAAEDAPETVREFVAGLVARGVKFDPRDVGEEMHCFDTENSLVSGEMSPGQAREYAGFAEAVDSDNLEAFRAWLANGNPLNDEAAEAFRESFAGVFSSVEDWAGDFLEDCGMLAELPEWAQTHQGALIRSWAHDAEQGDLWTAEVSDGIAIFHN